MIGDAALHQAVGRAVVVWGYIETHLAYIYAEVLHADLHAATSSFYSVQAFRGKLALVHAAVQDSFVRKPQHAALMKQWIAAKKRIEDLSFYRNEIVHFHAVPTDPSENEWIITKPHATTSAKGSPRKWKSLSVTDIERHCEAFEATAAEIRPLMWAFREAAIEQGLH